jgi:hypothetical protein
MSASRNRNPLSITPRGSDCPPQRRLGVDGNNTINVRLVELTMDVVDYRAGALCAG